MSKDERGSDYKDWAGQCATCRFWHQQRECHRFPPVISPHPAIVEGGDYREHPHVGVWPETEANCWCGEWVPIPP